MKNVAERPGYVWVRKIGRGWFPYISLIEQVTMPLGFVVAVTSQLLGFGQVATTIGVGLIVLSFLLLLPLSYALYNMLLCPLCGHNPMRASKAHKKIPHRTAFRKAAELTECPGCSQ